VFSVPTVRHSVRRKQAAHVAAEVISMSRKRIVLIAAGVLLLTLAGLVAYQFTGGKAYSSDVDALRTQFNADKGKVRLLVLLSPT